MTGRVITAAVAVAFFMAIASQAIAARIEVGKPAPDFRAVGLDGKIYSLADFKGQVLVINLWATWCGPCKKEMPLLDAYERAQGKYGLAVLAVTTEDSVPPSLLKPLAKALSLPLAKHISRPYSDFTAVPTNYVIDRSGVIRYAKAAAFDLDALNDLLVPLLQEPAPEGDDAASLKPAS